MAGYLPRELTEALESRLAWFPVVTILGPRQCGKTSLARAWVTSRPGSVMLDLERPSELARLRDPEAFFALHRDDLICLDEIQRAPDLFPVIRAEVDETGRAGRFLVLGSASPGLLRQGAETLAGRIAFLELTPFLIGEVEEHAGRDAVRRLWLRGGFPRSFLADSEDESFLWREEFVRTFLERDVPALSGRLDGGRIGRLWKMLAHVYGGLLNGSQLGAALGVSHHTVRAWLEILEKTFLVRILPPLEDNLGKRLVRTPRVYLRDTGILHALLGIRSQDDLLGHPVYGASWEGFVVEQVVSVARGYRPSFYRTRAGAEIDLLLESGRRRIAIECKASSAPTVGRGFWTALDDLSPDEAHVVAPVTEAYPIGRGVNVMPLPTLIEMIGGSPGSL